MVLGVIAGALLLTTLPEAPVGAAVVPDVAFAGDGSVDLVADGRTVFANASAVDHLGRTVVVSHCCPTVVLRLTPDGVLDPTFAGDGIAELADPDFEVRAVHADAGGITLGGVRSTSEYVEATGGFLRGLDPSIVRLADDGQPVVGFGTEGQVLLEDAWPGLSPGDFPPGGHVLDVAIDAEGRVVLARYDLESYEVPSTASLQRLLPNGSLDPQFGGDGTVDLPADDPADHVFPHALALDGATGRVFVSIAEYDLDAATASGSIRRLLPDGSVDSSFGSAGKVQVDEPVRSLLIDPDDGGIVAGGSAATGSGSIVRRFTSIGASDVAFGDGGSVTAQMVASSTPPGAAGFAGMALDANGRLLVATDDFDRTEVVRFDPEGHSDPTFTQGGRLTVTGSADGQVWLTGNRLVLVTRNDALQPSSVHAFRLTPGASAPEGVEATARNGSVSVRWRPPADNGGGAIRRYLVTAHDSDGTLAGFQVVEGDAHQVSVDELENEASYDLRVVAYTDAGAGEASRAISATPSAAAPPPGPAAWPDSIAGDLHVTSGAVTMRWTAPVDDGGSPILGYAVIVLDPRGEVSGWRNVGPDVRSATLTARFGRGHVVAVTATGFGRVYSDQGLVNPNPGTPVEPPAMSWVNQVPISASHAVAGWGAPVERGQPLTRIHVVVTKGSQFLLWKALPASARQLVVTAPPGAQVHVFAESAQGWGPAMAVTRAA